MNQLSEWASLESGTPQFRIKDSVGEDAAVYFFYGQSNLEDDLAGICSKSSADKMVRTADSVSTLRAGDVIFSLISGKAAVVGASHDGYLFTQNYVRIRPSISISSKYLVYMLNENDDIRRQLCVGQQGSATLKHTVAQLGALRFPEMPPPERRETIGSLYLNGLRLEALRRRRAALGTLVVKERAKEANRK